MKIAIGSDHAGFEDRQVLMEWLRSPEGGRHQIVDMGCPSPESCDYPDFAAAVARVVSTKRAERGILLCGSGIGMAIAADKVPGIRAATAWTPEIAGLAAEHNHANILSLPARYLKLPEIKEAISTYLKTKYGPGRHARRVKKIMELEKKAH